MTTLSWRRPCITETVDKFAVTVSYDPVALFLGKVIPVEVFMTQRSKSGSELEQHQINLGIIASRLMQSRFL